MITKTKSHFICFVTCPNTTLANKIAKALVSEKLAACVNIVKGIESIYSWNGKICKDSEVLLLIKGHNRNRKKLETRIKGLHSYDVPEIIFVQLDSGSRKYLDWINSNVD